MTIGIRTCYHITFKGQFIGVSERGFAVQWVKLGNTPDVDGCKSGKGERVMKCLPRDRTFGTDTHFLPCFFEFANLHRPIELKPDSKILVGVYLLHTCLILSVSGKGGLLSSGDYHAFTSKGYHQTIHRGCQYHFVTNGNQLLW